MLDSAGLKHILVRHGLPAHWADDPRYPALCNLWVAQHHSPDHLSSAELILFMKCLHHRAPAVVSPKPTRSDARPGDNWRGIDPRCIVRCKVLRFLCTDRRAQEFVNPYGIILEGATLLEISVIDPLPERPAETANESRVLGLDLGYARLPFPVELRRCFIPGGIRLTSARTRTFIVSASDCGPIQAAGVVVDGGLFLQDEFDSAGMHPPDSQTRVAGGLNLYNARLSRDLSAHNAMLLSADALHDRLPDGMDEYGRRFQAVTVASRQPRTLPVEPFRSGRLRPRHALNGDDLSVTNVYLRAGFRAYGGVRFTTARIRSDLHCERAVFVSPGDALIARGIRVRGDVFLCCLSRFIGQVDLSGADITGNLYIGDSEFAWRNDGERNPATTVDEYALWAEGLRVGGSVDARSPRGFRGDYTFPLVDPEPSRSDLERAADLRVSETRARCEHVLQLNLNGLRPSFKRRFQTAVGACQPSAVFCGPVSFAGAKIAGNCDLLGAWFCGTTLSPALRLRRARISGTLFVNAFFEESRLLAPFAASGAVELNNARISVYADSFISWPGSRDLEIEGLVYDDIVEDGGIAIGRSLNLQNHELDRLIRVLPDRIEWIERRRGADGPARWTQHDPKPYEQLISALRRAGRAREARDVLARERKWAFWSNLYAFGDAWRRSWEQRRLGATLVGIVRAVLQTLYYRTVGLLAALVTRNWTTTVWAGFLWVMMVAAGAWVFHATMKADPGSFSPAQAIVYTGAAGTPIAPHGGDWPHHYPEFSPIIYSLDAALPIINLHQESFWVPSPLASRKDFIDVTALGCSIRVTAGEFAHFYLVAHTALGWFLTTLIVIGLTKSMHHEQESKEE